jgi:hypothetical protein
MKAKLSRAKTGMRRSFFMGISERVWVKEAFI